MKTFSIFLNIETPGPGNYKAPSEFGYYTSKNSDEGKRDPLMRRTMK
jgi:hypothetical protein